MQSTTPKIPDISCLKRPCLDCFDSGVASETFLVDSDEGGKDSELNNFPGRYNSLMGLGKEVEHVGGTVLSAGGTAHEDTVRIAE